MLDAFIIEELRRRREERKRQIEQPQQLNIPGEEYDPYAESPDGLVIPNPKKPDSNKKSDFFELA